MKKVYGLLCIVALFALASCGGAKEVATDVENAAIEAEQTMDVVAPDAVEVMTEEEVTVEPVVEETTPEAMMDAEVTATGEVMMDAEVTATGEVMMEEVLPTEEATAQ